VLGSRWKRWIGGKRLGDDRAGAHQRWGGIIACIAGRPSIPRDIDSSVHLDTGPGVRFGTGNLFLSAAQSKLSGSNVGGLPRRLSYRPRHAGIMVLTPFVGRAGLDVSEPKAVRLGMIANASRAPFRDLDKAQGLQRPEARRNRFERDAAFLELSARDDQSAVLDAAVTHVLDFDDREDGPLNRLERPIGDTVQHDEAGHDEGPVGFVELVYLESFLSHGRAPIAWSRVPPRRRLRQGRRCFWRSRRFRARPLLTSSICWRA
jgi:hypothetical protein